MIIEPSEARPPFLPHTQAQSGEKFLQGNPRPQSKFGQVIEGRRGRLRERGQWHHVGDHAAGGQLRESLPRHCYGVIFSSGVSLNQEKTSSYRQSGACSEDEKNQYPRKSPHIHPQAKPFSSPESTFSSSSLAGGSLNPPPHPPHYYYAASKVNYFPFGPSSTQQGCTTSREDAPAPDGIARASSVEIRTYLCSCQVPRRHLRCCRQSTGKGRRRWRRPDFLRQEQLCFAFSHCSVGLRGMEKASVGVRPSLALCTRIATMLLYDGLGKKGDSSISALCESAPERMVWGRGEDKSVTQSGGGPRRSRA